MKIIPVRIQGTNVYLESLVDDDVYVWASKISWKCRIRKNNAGNFYAERNVKPYFLHQLVKGVKPSFQIDHKNHNTLDNRRENLRYATKSQQSANKRNHQRSRTSKFKGVSRSRAKAETFAAAIKINGYKKRRVFKTEIEAAQQFDEWAKSQFGEFAVLNFP